MGMTPEQTEHFRRRCDMMSEYVHPECGKRTQVPPKFVEAMVLDPYAFNNITMCSHCGEVPTSKVFMRNKKSAKHMVSKLREEAPISFKLVRFIGVRIAFAVIAAIMGVIVQVVSMDFLPIAGVAGVMAAIGALLGGAFDSSIAMALRRRGMLW